ncbi:MAG: hypothetical protein IKI78_04960 [Clostridia bacterium]|nr:hypothetical protein [Clostridia bacterium]
MKKAVCILLILILAFSLASCGSGSGTRSGTVQNGKSVDDILSSASDAGTAQAKTQASVENLKIFSKNIPDGSNFDVDLTELNKTMVYTRVSDMVMNPNEYEGKSVKMKGTYAVYEGEGRNYYACLISDATACCSQGLEFLPKKQLSYPADFPPDGTDITVTGIFDIYYEGENRYFQLKDAGVYYGG